MSILKIILRKEALEQGLKRYYTGKPCRRGHLSERNTGGRQCVDCASKTNAEWKEANLERKQHTDALWLAANADRKAFTDRRWVEANAERIAETGAKWREENKERKAYTNARWNAANKARKREVNLLWLSENSESHAVYNASWYAANKERRADTNAAWYTDNKEHVARCSRRWKDDNRDWVRANNAAWCRANPHVLAAKNSRRRANKLNATPAWLNEGDLFFIGEAYALSALRTKITGVKWHVDHIIPLQGADVCGLHAPNNLQVITATENCMKSNQFIVT